MFARYMEIVHERFKWPKPPSSFLWFFLACLYLLRDTKKNLGVQMLSSLSWSLLDGTNGLCTKKWYVDLFFFFPHYAGTWAHWKQSEKWGSCCCHNLPGEPAVSVASLQYPSQWPASAGGAEREERKDIIKFSELITWSSQENWWRKMVMWSILLFLRRQHGLAGHYKMARIVWTQKAASTTKPLAALHFSVL